MTPEERTSALQTAGLDWKVREEEVQTLSGIVIPKTIALVRDDNNDPLGIHTVGYDPYQNEELLDLLTRVTEQSGLQYHSGGLFDGGRKVYLQLKSTDLDLPDGDKVKGFISGFNSFDGSTSLAFGNYNLTVSCRNSFWRGYHSVESRFRHSQRMRLRLDEILFKVDKLLEEEQDTFAKIKKLNSIELDDAVKQLVIDRMFDLDKEEKLDKEYSTRRKNQLIKFESDLQSELASKGNTLWGLFSGVTKYTTHSMKKTDNSEAKIFGAAGRKERQIWNELVESAYFV
jgi:phage/plasmid-like protein (TIGR03299 family)